MQYFINFIILNYFNNNNLDHIKIVLKKIFYISILKKFYKTNEF